MSSSYFFKVNLLLRILVLVVLTPQAHAETLNCPKYPQDSSDCIQRAIDDLNNREIIIPDGQYFLSERLEVERSNLRIVGENNSVIFTNEPVTGPKTADYGLFFMGKTASNITLQGVTFRFAEILRDSNYSESNPTPEQFVLGAIAEFRGSSSLIQDVNVIGPKSGEGPVHADGITIANPAENLRFLRVNAHYTVDTRYLYPGARLSVPVAYAWEFLGNGEKDGEGIALLTGPRNITLEDCEGAYSAKEGLKIDRGGAPNLRVIGGSYYENFGDGWDIVGLMDSAAYFEGSTIRDNGGSAIECKPVPNAVISQNFTLKDLIVLNNKNTGIALWGCPNVLIDGVYIEGNETGLILNPGVNVTVKNTVIYDKTHDMAAGISIREGTNNVTFDRVASLQVHDHERNTTMAIYMDRVQNVSFDHLVIDGYVNESGEAMTRNTIYVSNESSNIVFANAYSEHTIKGPVYPEGSVTGIDVLNRPPTSERRTALTNFYAGLSSPSQLLDRLFPDNAQPMSPPILRIQ
ncbi:right-handed parallel beta-helix repeat-containing protein [Thiocystis violacea]|uniref:right-handed parallel beta-helix repeat-containing protein n=1 Tax=Thiocystis violacea TaxID=13725 RepID=UPI0019061A66|nr:right-handed parallel beta-helix repeat-containing protein [Thiocystis violacea]